MIAMAAAAEVARRTSSSGAASGSTVAMKAMKAGSRAIWRDLTKKIAESTLLKPKEVVRWKIVSRTLAQIDAPTATTTMASTHHHTQGHGDEDYDENNNNHIYYMYNKHISKTNIHQEKKYQINIYKKTRPY